MKVVLLFDTPTPYEEHQNFAISKQFYTPKLEENAFQKRQKFLYLLSILYSSAWIRRRGRKAAILFGPLLASIVDLTWFHGKKMETKLQRRSSCIFVDVLRYAWQTKSIIKHHKITFEYRKPQIMLNLLRKQWLCCLKYLLIKAIQITEHKK